MENKINIAELLKDCPQGMELYSPVFGKVYLDKIRPHLAIVVTTNKERGDFKEEFLYDGRYRMNGECMLFPSKGKTTWEGFVPPCKFKDGDIITDSFGTCIFKGEGEFEGTVNYYCGISNDYFHIKDDKCNPSGHYGYIVNYRLSTEEEKQKLFDAIKANGYKWNAETKTLEKLIEPKFKVGDKIVKLNSVSNSWIVSSVSSEYYGLKLPKGIEGIGVLPVSEQDDWELVSNIKPKFKVGDTIQDEDEYKVKITEVNLEDKCYGYESIIAKGIGSIAFSEQNNWKLILNIKPKFKVGDRVRNKNYKDYIYTIHDIVDKGYSAKEINADSPIIILFGSQEDNYELVPNKFDITTLVPFESKVLVRDKNNDKWIGQFFSHYDNGSDRPYVCIGIEGLCEYKKCIPFKNNEYLLGTNDDCNEYYKTW